MRDLPLDAHTWNLAIDAAAALERPAACVAVLCGLEEAAALGNTSLAPDAFSYGRTIGACCAVGDKNHLLAATEALSRMLGHQSRGGNSPPLLQRQQQQQQQQQQYYVPSVPSFAAAAASAANSISSACDRQKHLSEAEKRAVMISLREITHLHDIEISK